MAYYFYMDKMLCPVAPSKLQMKIKGQNKTLTLINEGEVNTLKKAGLTEVSFDLLLPNVKYPFATYKSGFQDAKYFLSEIEKLKTNKKPFQFIVTRTFPNGKMLFDTNMKVSLEDYTIKEDSKDGFDVVVSIKLKQYREYSTKTCNVTFVDSKPKVSVENTRPSNNAPTSNKTHTVVKGDCLWAIAQKYYGNGSKYPVIYEANKTLIDSVNNKYGNSKYTIYSGQVLTIPAI